MTCCMAGRKHEPRWYCDGGPGCFQSSGSFHRFNYPVLTLEAGHALGKRGLDRMFAPGTLWNYGTVYENMDTVFRVTGGPYQHKDIRDHNLPGAPATWFVKCEVVSSPHSITYSAGKEFCPPPCALVPHAAVEADRAARLGGGCCCRANPQQDYIDGLLDRIANLTSDLEATGRREREAQSKARRLQQQIDRAKTALKGSL